VDFLGPSHVAGGDERTFAPFLDATLGIRPVEKVLVLLQTFNISAIHTAPLLSTRSNKIALSAVYEVTHSISVQVGGIIGLPGVENTTTERGVISAVWYRF
jgi:hypothetical protein